MVSFNSKKKFLVVRTNFSRFDVLVSYCEGILIMKVCDVFSFSRIIRKEVN